MSGRRFPRQGYDESTGQVFTDSEVPVTRKHNSDWIGEYKTPSLIKRLRPNDQGARSLFDMAKAQVARQMRSLTMDHLRDVPWPVVERLWDEIEAIRSESFHSWRILASTQGEMFSLQKHRYFLDIKRPPLPFKDYFRGITSSSIDWLTCLRISPKYLDRTDLVAIAGIKNLAVLDLSDSLTTVEPNISPFDERIMRVWSELARENASFKHLGVLLLGWQKNVAPWMFKYLASFPSLRLVVVTACPDLGQYNRREWESTATETGWEARHAKKSAQSMRPILNDDGFCFGAVSSSLYETTGLPGDTTIAEKQNKKPVLECWLGGPPPWEPVVKDFPKATQTVWFDRVNKPHSNTQNATQIDHIKRSRDVEIATTDTRSPPPKRTGVKMKLKKGGTTVADLLSEFTREI